MLWNYERGNVRRTMKDAIVALRKLDFGAGIADRVIEIVDILNVNFLHQACWRRDCQR